MSSQTGTYFRPTGTTRMGGLIGFPTTHSLSPMMHNDSFALCGIDFVYLCFDVTEDALGGVVSAFRAVNTYGFNVTMPHKRAVIPYLDKLSPEADLCGAVNTVVNKDGSLIGHNTDGTGFIRGVRESGCDISGKEITMIGAGGAGSAIASAAVLSDIGSLNIVCRRSRSWENSERLVRKLQEASGCKVTLIDLSQTDLVRTAVRNSCLLINATNVGMAPDIEKMPISDPEIFHPGLTAADVIYHPRKTAFLAEAEKHGCRTVSGLEMLLCQGQEAFTLWTGKEMPADIIRERYFS